MLADVQDKRMTTMMNMKSTLLTTVLISRMARNPEYPKMLLCKTLMSVKILKTATAQLRLSIKVHKPSRRADVVIIVRPRISVIPAHTIPRIESPDNRQNMWLSTAEKHLVRLFSRTKILNSQSRFTFRKEARVHARKQVQRTL